MIGHAPMKIMTSVERRREQKQKNGHKRKGTKLGNKKNGTRKGFIFIEIGYYY